METVPKSKRLATTPLLVLSDSAALRPGTCRRLHQKRILATTSSPISKAMHPLATIAVPLPFAMGIATSATTAETASAVADRFFQKEYPKAWNACDPPKKQREPKKFLGSLFFAPKILPPFAVACTPIPARIVAGSIPPEITPLPSHVLDPLVHLRRFSRR